MYASNTGSQEMIGIAATYNTGHKILSSGGAIGLNLNTRINNQIVDDSYTDKGESWIELAYMLNMFVDEPKNGYAASVNLNKHTYNTVAELVSRGVRLNTAFKIINHPFVKALVNQANIYNDTITNVALRSLGTKKNFLLTV